MGIWDVWKTVFQDSRWEMSQYDYLNPLPQVQPTVANQVLSFGVHNAVMVNQITDEHLPIINYLRIKLPRRYQDVDVTVRVEIPNAAHTARDQQGNYVENTMNWFGVTTRALSAAVWDSYLFYIRRNGRIEFGIHGVHEGNPVPGPPPEPNVATRDVTIRIQVEGDHIRTWVNNSQRHDLEDEDRRFIRRGDIYLIAYGVLANVYEIEVKIKRWYAPLIRFVKRSWKVLVVLGVLIGIAAGIITISQLFGNN